jgi:hypothetical protein
MPTTRQLRPAPRRFESRNSAKYHSIVLPRIARPRGTVAHTYWRSPANRLRCRMAKKREHVDNLIDALVWMRRKAKKHEPVDDLIDALVKMRRKAKKKVAKRNRTTKTKTKTRRS